MQKQINKNVNLDDFDDIFLYHFIWIISVTSNTIIYNSKPLI